MRGSSNEAYNHNPNFKSITIGGGAAEPRMCTSGDVYFSHDLLFLSYTGAPPPPTVKGSNATAEAYSVGAEDCDGIVDD